jgi:hypothetical protein
MEDIGKRAMSSESSIPKMLLVSPESKSYVIHAEKLERLKRLRRRAHLLVLNAVASALGLAIGPRIARVRALHAFGRCRGEQQISIIP